MTCELAFVHGVAWWCGGPIVPIEVEPAPHGWTAHVLADHGGFAISVDEETKDELETFLNKK